jgi:hypothetical protein
MFGITSYQTLGNTISTLTNATVRAYSILSPVYSKSKLLGNYTFHAGYCPPPASTITVGTFDMTVTPSQYTWALRTKSTYLFSTIPSSINEGSAGTFNVVTTGVPDNTVLYWSITYALAQNIDFSGVSGLFTITSNSGSFTISPVADSSTEGPENYSVTVRSGSVIGTILTSTNLINIGDTSLDPFVPAVAAFAGGTAAVNTFSYWSSNQSPNAVAGTYAQFEFNTNGTVSVSYSSPSTPLYGYVDRYVNTFTGTGTNYDIKVDMRVGDGVQRSSAATTDYYVLGNFEAPSSGNSTGWVNLGVQRTIRVELPAGATSGDYVKLVTNVSIGPTGAATTSTSSYFGIDIGAI